MALPDDFLEFIYPTFFRARAEGAPGVLPDWVTDVGYRRYFHLFGFRDAMRQAGFSRVKDLLPRADWDNQQVQDAVEAHIPQPWIANLPDQFQVREYRQNTYWQWFAKSQVERSEDALSQSLPSALQSIVLLDYAATRRGLDLDFTAGATQLIIRPALFQFARWADNVLIDRYGPAEYGACLLDMGPAGRERPQTLEKLDAGRLGTYRTAYLHINNVRGGGIPIFPSPKGGTKATEIFAGRQAVVHPSEV